MNSAFSNLRRSQSDSPEQSISVLASHSPRVTETARLTREIGPNKLGRLRYQATDWNAQSIDNAYIPAGTVVRPVTRQGNTWFVASANPV